MEITECDLSFDHAKIDFEALSYTVKTAFHALKNEINRSIRKIDDEYWQNDESKYIHFRSYASLIARDAKDLEKIAEVLDTIEGMRTRENVEFVNKPQII